jgi:hypothetical protein
MSIDTHTFGFNMIINVGEITDRKIKQLIDYGYTFVHRLDDEGALFWDRDNKAQITIGPKAIAYTPTVDIVDSFLHNPDDAFVIFRELLDILLLDDSSHLFIQIERIYETEFDAYIKSWGILADRDFLSFEGAVAVGYRIPVIRDRFYGEVKIEPLFSDQKRFFVSLALQSTEPNTLDIGKEITVEMLELFLSLEGKAKELFY